MEQGRGAHRPAAAPTGSGKHGDHLPVTGRSLEPGSSAVGGLQLSSLGAADREAQITRVPSTSQDAKIRAVHGGDKGELFAKGAGSEGLRCCANFCSCS